MSKELIVEQSIPLISEITFHPIGFNGVTRVQEGDYSKVDYNYEPKGKSQVEIINQYTIFLADYENFAHFNTSIKFGFTIPLSELSLDELQTIYSVALDNFTKLTSELIVNFPNGTSLRFSHPDFDIEKISNVVYLDIQKYRK